MDTKGKANLRQRPKTLSLPVYFPPSKRSFSLPNSPRAPIMQKVKHSTDAIISIRRPSEEECIAFYRGLQPRPRLIARASTHSWHEKHDVHWGNPPKRLAPITNPRVGKDWDAIWPDALSKLEGAKADWEVIDVADIGEGGGDSCGVVWLGCEAGKCGFEEAASAITIIKRAIALSRNARSRR